MSADAISGPVRVSSRRMQLPEEVATYVRELIVSGEARPGDYLRIDRIAEAVGVSTTPVREGLLALRSEGFVRQIPRRGFVVAEFRQQDIRDLFWAQAVLAGELASRAAKLITPEQLSRLDRIVIAYDAALEANDKVALVAQGHAFHREINLAADAIRLASLLGAVVKTLPPRFYGTIDGWVNASHRDHPRIVEALRKRDANGVNKLMTLHIYLGADQLIESMEARGVWNEVRGPDGIQGATA